MSTKGTGNLKNDLNEMNPPAYNAKLGDMLETIISNQNYIMAKLDAIGGAGASSTAIATAAGTNNVATKTQVLPSKL
jgi:hypothetical protein